MSVLPRNLKVGGPVDPEENLYIERSTDAEFVELLRAREFVTILTSRQMGKTSLVYRAMSQLIPEGVRFAYMDLSPMRNEPNARVYFRTLIEELARDLDLAIDLDAFWNERQLKANGGCLVDFFRMALEMQEESLVVVLDEIDSTLVQSQDTYTDDLFTTFRSLYTSRQREPSLKRLAVCLVGVATPTELIKARRTTPYNVGRTLWLADFDPADDDLTPLARFLSGDQAIGEAMLARLLYWTGGQPYLTMWIASELRHSGANCEADVDYFVEARFATLELTRGDAHFEQVERIVFSDRGGTEVLALYERILKRGSEFDKPAHPAHSLLRLSGLVRRTTEGRLVVRNPIYGNLFNETWVANSRPIRRQRALNHLMASILLMVLVVVTFAVFYFRVTPDPHTADSRTALAELGFEVDDQEGLTLVRLRTRGEHIPDSEGEANILLSRAGSYLEALGRSGAARPLALDLSGLPLSDITPLSGLVELQALGLSSTLVRDLAVLSRLKRLKRLELAGTPVSDIGPLIALKRLDFLDISFSSVRDLAPLSKLPSLRSLLIDGIDSESSRQLKLQVYGATRPLVDMHWSRGDEFRGCSDCPVMVVVSAGEYVMGSPLDEKGRFLDEGPQHTVRIAAPFAVGKFEVSVEEWEVCVSAGACVHTPAYVIGRPSREPVVNVSWDDAQEYLRWLSGITGQRYRLLSESEWEYSARAGSTAIYPWGNQLDTNMANVNLSHVRLSDTQPTTVGRYPANAFGLHDMIGNVWEWVEDCWNSNYVAGRLDGRPWDIAVCSLRVARGGSWNSNPTRARSASRSRFAAGFRANNVGFRVATALSSSPP